MPSVSPTVRHALNFLGSAVAGKFVPLASIFVFSHLMTVAEYGILNLFTSFIWVFGIAVSLNLHTALGRYAYLPAPDLPAFLGTTQIALAVLLAASTAGLLGFSDLASGLTGLPAITLPLLMAVVAGQLAESLLTQYAVFRQTSGTLLRVIAGKAVLTFGVAIGLLQLVSQDRHLAVISADALLSILLVLYTVWAFKDTTRWQFNRPLFAYILRYSLPLIPYMLSITLLAQLDRMMLDRYFGKEAVGLYSLAFNIGMLFTLVMSALLSAMNPRFFSAMNDGRHDEVRVDGRRAFCVAYLIATALVAFGPALSAYLVPSEYAPALQLVPAIAVGGLFSVMFQVWGRLMHFAHRTALLSAIATVCVLLKILANLWLLPAFGWEAAALSSIVAYGAMAILTALLVNLRLRLLVLPVRFETGTCLALCAFAMLLHLAPLSQGVDLAARLLGSALLAWPCLHAVLRPGAVPFSHKVATS